MSDPLADLARILEAAQIEYALIGGHAVNAWIEPRFTADIDVTVEAGVEKVRRLSTVLAEAGYRIVAQHGDEPSGPDFVRFRSNDEHVTFEFQAAKTELQRELIRRAQTRLRGLRVATAEDLILLKLIANRPKDRLDMIGLCRLPVVDWEYVERWAEEWELAELLERIRAEARS